MDSKSIKKKPSSLPPKRKGADSNGIARISKKRAGDLGTIEELQRLKKSVLLSNANLNDLLKLFEFLESGLIEVVYAGMKAIQSIMVTLIKRGDIILYKPLKAPKQAVDPAKAQVSEWLSTVYKKWIKKLVSLIDAKDPALQVAAIECILTLLREDSVYGLKARKCYVINTILVDQLTENLVKAKNLSDELVQYLLEKFLNRYHDIRYYLLKSLAVNLTKEIKRAKAENVELGASLAETMFKLVSGVRVMPTKEADIKEFYAVHPGSLSLEDGTTEKVEEKREEEIEEDDLGDDDVFDEEFDIQLRPEPVPEPVASSPKHFLLQITTHQREFEEAWLAFFRMNLTSSLLKKTLLMVHHRLLPNFLHPLALLDFLTDSYDHGGSISLLALNGLFTLIHKYNMDYPDFYPQLYRQFTPDLLHVKYRSRFFRLAELFMGSGYLPGNLVAAFVKRMSRLALHAPPGGIVILLPFIYNLLKAHPNCMQMIHRTDEITCGADDPYDFTEPDPIKSGAVQSSLWELEAMTRHYYPNVSSLAKMFTEKFTKPTYVMEDFLDHNFNSMIEVELSKPFKKVPALNPDIPGSLFSDKDEQPCLDMSKEWEF